MLKCLKLPKLPKLPDSVKNNLDANMRSYGMLLSLAVIMVFFQYMTGGTLFQPLNLTNLILQNSYIVIMALAMLMIIVAGHIDLSVGAVAGFVGGLAAVLMVDYQWHYIPTTIVCLLAGVLIGALQGYFVAYHKIPAFITTLGGMLIFRGATLALLKGQSVGPFPETFQLLSSGFIPDWFAGESLRILSMALGCLVATVFVFMNMRSRAKRIHYGLYPDPYALAIVKNVIFFAVIVGFTYQLASYKGLPNILIIMLVLIWFFDLVTTRTVLGRRIYAIGGNEAAARLSGVDTKRITLYAFMNMGALAALAGLIFAARLNTATPKAGNGFELDVIAACFIGGASATGGAGKVTGAVIGALIMGVLNNGMSLLGWGIDYQQIIKGAVLVAAVFVDIRNQNKK